VENTFCINIECLYKFNNVRKLIPFLLFTAVISSCEKLETPENVKGLIRYVKSGAQENKKFDEEYIYHSDGTLRERIEYVNDSVYKFHVYEFIDDEKLKSIRSFGKDTILISETFFEFNNSGLIIKESYYNSLYQQQFGYNGSGLYEYYENNLLSKASFFDKNGELMHYYTFEDYDEKGNYRIRKVFGTKSDEARFVIEYLYSDALNPFHIYCHPWYSNINMESSISGWGSSDYAASYEINNFGYPTKRELTYSSGYSSGYVYYTYY